MSSSDVTNLDIAFETPKSHVSAEKVSEKLSGIKLKDEKISSASTSNSFGMAVVQSKQDEPKKDIAEKFTFAADSIASPSSAPPGSIRLKIPLMGGGKAGGKLGRRHSQGVTSTAILVNNRAPASGKSTPNKIGIAAPPPVILAQERFALFSFFRLD